MAEVRVSDEFKAWYLGLDDLQGDAIARVVTLLETHGVALGWPFSSSIEGSRYALRELRCVCRGRHLRVLYAFDPDREAYLILGGDKTGNERWYETFVPRAEKLWVDYLAEREEKTR